MPLEFSGTWLGVDVYIIPSKAQGHVEEVHPGFETGLILRPPVEILLEDPVLAV